MYNHTYTHTHTHIYTYIQTYIYTAELEHVEIRQEYWHQP